MAQDSAYTASNAHKINFKQDLPPPGGYSKIYWERTFPRTWVNARRLALIAAGSIGYAFLASYASRSRYQTMVMIDNDEKLAITPFIFAERDRLILKQNKKLREAEMEVMKDVDGWKLGTYWGEPLYFTLGDRWWDLTFRDHYVHNHDRDRSYGWAWGNHYGYGSPHWYDPYIPIWFKDFLEAFYA